jgi:hypothetical protein
MDLPAGAPGLFALAAPQADAFALVAVFVYFHTRPIRQDDDGVPLAA